MLFKQNTLAGYFNKGPISLSSIFGESNLKSIKRYFTEFLASANSFGSFSSSVTLDDEFSITITTASTSGTFSRLLGNQSSFDNQLRLNSDDASLLIRASGGTEHTINFDSTITRAQLNTIRVYRSQGSSTVNLDVNGVTQAATATESGAFVFDTINVSFGVYGDGPLMDLEIEKAGSLIHSYPMDEEPNATEFVDRVGSNNITKQNIAASQVQLYDQVDDGWTGPELEPTPFNISTWTATTGEILVPPNQIELGDSVGGAFKAYGISGIHRLSVTASSEGTSMQIKDSSTGAGLDPDITTGNPINGAFDYNFVNGGVYFRTTGSGGDRVTINEYSLKRLLEVA